MARFEVIAVNDKESHCECCGRQGLKRVVWIHDTETGEHKHFGTTCATAPAKGFNVQREVKEAIGRWDSYQTSLNWAARAAYKAAGGQYVANADGYSWSHADPALYQQCRAQVAAAGKFNY